MNFSFVGYLRPTKDTEVRKGFSKTSYSSGWMSERLRFSVVAGDNRHFVEINAGRFEQEDKNVIYGFTKGDTNHKGETVRIPWAKRNDPATIESMAGWKVYTVDLDTYNHRKQLEESGDEEGLEVSRKKCKHFLAGTEFAEYVNKLVNSEKIKDKKFRVRGNVNYSYSEKNDQYYVTYEVNKIYMVDDDKEPSSDIGIDFYFTENAMDSDSLEETGKAIVNGYTPFYDSMTKKNWFCPISLIVRDKVEGWARKFNKFDNDEVRKIGLVCQKIDGAQRVDVKLEDLSEDVRESIADGLITEEEAIRDAGGQMYGDRVQEIRIIAPAKGYYGGSETTVYTVDDMLKKPKLEVVEEDIVEDLFDDDDEL